jgi:hypothetical protein
MTTNLVGTAPEIAVYLQLLKLGKRPDVDFTFQSPLMGGRMQRGGLVLDFLFSNPPDLAISVVGRYFHFELGGLDQRARDLMSREQLLGQGITLIFIEDDDIERDAAFYVKEALAYRDHSRLGGLG